MTKLLVGLLTQFVEHCTGLAGVVGSNPVRAWIPLFGEIYVRASSKKGHLLDLEASQLHTNGRKELLLTKGSWIEKGVDEGR